MNQILETCLSVIAKEDGYQVRKVSLVILYKMKDGKIVESLSLGKYYEKLQIHDNFSALLHSMNKEVFDDFCLSFNNSQSTLASSTDTRIEILANSILSLS